MYSNEDYLSELITEAGLLSPDAIAQARAQLTGAESIIEKLINDRIVSEEQVAQVCAQASSMEYVDLYNTSVDSELFEAVPEEVAKRFNVVPVSYDGYMLTVALADPLNFEILDTLPHVLGREVNPVCAAASAITQIIQRAYGGEEAAADEYAFDDAEGETGDAPIIRMVQDILAEALRMRASDIHIEPLEASLRIRYRVDGKLIEVANHPKKLLPAIIARLKVMSGTMSIAEKRLPQDGRIQIKAGDKEIDLRVSSVPSNHGESIVMRILDKSALVLGLGELGFLSDDQEDFRRYIKLPDGIILVTGPTGFW